MTISKEDWIKLAEGYIRQDKYEDAVRDSIYSLADDHGQERDFLGMSLATGAIMNPVLDILGDDFAYFHYDCGGDYNRFNKGITLADGTHPNIRSLSGLYKFAKEQGSIK